MQRRGLNVAQVIRHPRGGDPIRGKTTFTVNVATAGTELLHPPATTAPRRRSLFQPLNVGVTAQPLWRTKFAAARRAVRMVVVSSGLKEDCSMRKRVAIGAAALTLAALCVPAAASAEGPGASVCQPAAGQRTAGLAQALGGLGPVASVVAGSAPGAIAALNQQDHFHCP
jgi:hypothetical protein